MCRSVSVTKHTTNTRLQLSPTYPTLSSPLSHMPLDCGAGRGVVLLGMAPHNLVPAPHVAPQGLGCLGQVDASCLPGIHNVPGDRGSMTGGTVISRVPLPVRVGGWGVSAECVYGIYIWNVCIEYGICKWNMCVEDGMGIWNGWLHESILVSILFCKRALEAVSARARGW